MFTLDILSSYLIVGAALMALGMLGFLTRRNLIVMFLSAELMLQGASLSLVAFGRYHGNWSGQVFAIIILTVAASEAAIALALVLVLYNRRGSLDISLWNEVREPGTVGNEEEAEADEAEALQPVAGPESYPRLTPAGVEPPHSMQPWEQRRD